MRIRPCTSVLILISLLTSSLLSCGRPSELEELREAGMVPVSGVAGFGTQCPFGSVSPPSGVKLQLWNCPIGLEQLQLTQPLEALWLQADCKKKFLSVRMDQHRYDSNWNTMPDGSFFITIDAGLARLAADSPTGGPCATPLSADLVGKMDCTDPDRAKITFETIWWMGKATDNATREAANPACTLPSSCYLYASTAITQCE